MSTKRRADKYLTDQNWDQEDDHEDAGKFEAASKDVLQKRTFKKAKRRIGQQGEDTSAFKDFGGLTSSKHGEKSNGFQGFKLHSASSVFTLPDKLAAEKLKAKNNNEKEKSPFKESKFPSIKTNPATSMKYTMSAIAAEKQSTDGSKMSEYDRHLAALNRSVSKWIAEHVTKDPLCDLTPVFEDYQQHYSNIEDKYACVSSSPSDASLEGSNTPMKTESPATNIIIPSQSARPKTPPKNPLGNTLQKTTTASPFKGFGLVQDKDKPSTSGFSGFQFGSTMVASSGVKTAIERDAQTSSAAEEDEYVPPKPECKTVEEKNAFYTKRCKLFYMKDGTYTEKGVGNIHLKEVPSTKKTQLVVRADTSLGNLLLNIILNSAMPITKQGKNNVSLSCVPNPPIDDKNSDKVVTMLIRVKTSEDADELIEILNKKKQESD